jgi:threonine/homoserine/homoserine lactone efflux protein
LFLPAEEERSPKMSISWCYGLFVSLLEKKKSLSLLLLLLLFVVIVVVFIIIIIIFIHLAQRQAQAWSPSDFSSVTQIL